MAHRNTCVAKTESVIVPDSFTKAKNVAAALNASVAADDSEMLVTHRFEATLVSVAVDVSLTEPRKANELAAESVAVAVSAMVEANV